MTRRLGAYVLAADPTWLRSSVARYYDRLDALVVSATQDGRGWTGRPVPAQACVELLDDPRGVARVVRGRWVDPGDPLAAEVAQRKDALAALVGEVDWVLQLDTDEVLPDVGALLRAIDLADEVGAVAVEWPMRVLYRRLRDGRYLQVVGRDGRPRYDYPGPVAVRADATLVHARRTDGRFVRLFVDGDTSSAESARPAGPLEVRRTLLSDADAIVHNSWARDLAGIRGKVASWGHHAGWRSWVYVYGTWLPANVRWRTLHDFHPMQRGLWPRLAPYEGDLDALLVPADR